MSRSVSYATGSKVVIYDYIPEGSLEDECFFEYYTENIREYIKEKYPSFEDCEKWIGREDKAILENKFVYIGISEYCGLISLWIKPKEEYINLEEKFIRSITPYFMGLASLRKMGTFSNGEAVYKKIEEGGN